ncbi:MAG: NAD-dependent dihydropyrimidine dehydrogenase subunit PreA [Vampirovibrionales bacterium]
MMFASFSTASTHASEATPSFTPATLSYIERHGRKLPTVTQSHLAPEIDLSVTVGGIWSPNPFWLASAPPTNTKKQVARAFERGWGGAVWKTLGDDIENVSSRYGALHFQEKRIMGLNNIELISDRTVEENLADMAWVKTHYPHHTLVASLMFEEKARWQEVVKACEAIGVDGFELNFGCPHGMCERGMGSVVGQNPELVKNITGWVREVTSLPILVKLTPNITDITQPAMAAYEGGATGIALINTVQSIIGVDLDTWSPMPSVGNYEIDPSSGMLVSRPKGTHGGYAGPAVKPIALNKVSEVAQAFTNHSHAHTMGISGIGGVSNWRDALEFMLLGSQGVQVCTAVMHHGFGIVGTMIDGVALYAREKGLSAISELTGKALPQRTSWEALDKGYHHIARINPETCIGCQKCFHACEDGAHQAILQQLDRPKKVPQVLEEACVGCNLCMYVCPVDDCITMESVPA